MPQALCFYFVRHKNLLHIHLKHHLQSHFLAHASNLHNSEDYESYLNTTLKSLYTYPNGANKNANNSGRNNTHTKHQQSSYKTGIYRFLISLTLCVSKNIHYWNF